MIRQDAPILPTRFYAGILKCRFVMYFFYVSFQCILSLHDKTGRAHITYKVLRQYPEELIQKVFESMRQDSIITKIKVGALLESF